MNMVRRPKIIVFDLDYTLWPFWVDTHVSPPFRRKYVWGSLGNGNVVDSYGTKIKYYPEVPQILENLWKEGYTLAVASRTGEIEGAYQLLNLFKWDKYFAYKEIFPGSKVTHFNNIRSKSGISFDDMIFFDDERRNIQDLTRHGVESILVGNGITSKVVLDGLKKYSTKYV